MLNLSKIIILLIIITNLELFIVWQDKNANREIYKIPSNLSTKLIKTKILDKNKLKKRKKADKDDKRLKSRNRRKKKYKSINNIIFEDEI